MARRLMVLGALLVAAAVTLWGCSAEMATVVVTQEPSEVETTPLPTATVPVLPTGTPEPTPAPVVEERTAEVEWPGSMRVGDGEVIRLSLLAGAEATAVGTPEVAEHDVETEMLEMAVARAGYRGTVNASLTAAGLEVTAAGPAEQPLAPGGVNTWRWTVSAPQAGTYRPVVNVMVRWEPEEGAGPVVEEPVWSRVLTVEARGFFGLSGAQTDWVGLGGSALGTVAGLPFLEKVLTTAWRRLRGRREEGSGSME